MSPTVILSYEMNRQLNLYAKYSQGYRSGGFNGEATTLAELKIPFDPEIVDAFELGLKSRMLDDRLQLNISAFWNENKDKQLVVFRGGASAASNIINAGKARIRGLEIEASARPGDNLNVRAGFAYLVPKYKQFLDRGVNVADNRSFPHAPKYTISTGVDWTAAEWGDVKLNIIGDLNFVSSYFTGAAALRPVGNEVSAYNGRSPGRVIVDGRAVLSNLPIGETTAKLSVWGRNLFNEDKPNFIIDFGPSFGGMTEAYFPEPRTYGLTLGVNF